MATKKKEFQFAVIGYGPSYGMGPTHINSVLKNKGFQLCAVCDPSKERREAAETDYPGVQTFAKADTMLKKAKPDICIIITPHNTHADLALQCLNAGAHVVLEKPMAITQDEIKEILATAKKKKKVVSCFHNRRWDSDFLVLQSLLKKKLIGDVFRIDAHMIGYHKHPNNWRADKKISGGATYDWGAHFTDWILNLADAKILSVSGFKKKNPAWKSYSNEDHGEVHIRFDSGLYASLTISNLAAVDIPRWQIMGTKGSIVSGNDAFHVTSFRDGRAWKAVFPYSEGNGDWNAYYKNFCEHLRDGKPLNVTGESAGRVICVLHSADMSAETNGEPIVPMIR